MKSITLLLALFALLFISTFAQITQLEASTFFDQLDKPNHKTFVAFTRTFCSHCRNLQPTLESLANHYKNHNNVTISQVDCGDNKYLCQGFDVSGYPTMNIFENQHSIEYMSDRSLSSLIEAIEELKPIDPVIMTRDDLPTPFQIVINETSKDLDEIIKLRKNALAVIVIATAIITMVITIILSSFYKKTVGFRKDKQD
jgi:thioredoxin-like negative regulator of GroEL